MSTKREDGYCTFCGSRRHEVRALVVARPEPDGVAICDGCVLLAVGIMMGERDGGEIARDVRRKLDARCERK
jgi:hypothetical protein